VLVRWAKDQRALLPYFLKLRALWKELIMKSKLVVLAVLSLGLGVAHASPFPMDAEANFSLPAADTYADQQARSGKGATSASWGVSMRQVEAPNPFPFGGGYIDD
jgi:hypothetical protein